MPNNPRLPHCDLSVHKYTFQHLQARPRRAAHSHAQPTFQRRAGIIHPSHVQFGPWLSVGLVHAVRVCWGHNGPSLSLGADLAPVCHAAACQERGAVHKDAGSSFLFTRRSSSLLIQKQAFLLVPLWWSVWASPCRVWHYKAVKASISLCAHCLGLIGDYKLSALPFLPPETLRTAFHWGNNDTVPKLYWRDVTATSWNSPSTRRLKVSCAALSTP